MIPVQFDYAAPTSLVTALQLLQDNPGSDILAGGHQMIATLKQGSVSPSLLIDLRKIIDLRGIQPQVDGGIRLGALTTYAEIASSETIKDKYTCLAQAASAIGDAQIRNWETVGAIGAYRDLARDWSAVALVLDAQFQLLGSQGNYTLTTEQLLAAIDPEPKQLRDIVTAIDFTPPGVNSGSAYVVMNNPASSHAVCGIAAYVELTPAGTVAQCRLAVTGATPLAQRLPQIETALEGNTPNPDTLTNIPNLARAGNLKVIGDRYASAQYRTHLIGILSQRALNLAIEQAGATT